MRSFYSFLRRTQLRREISSVLFLKLFGLILLWYFCISPVKHRANPTEVSEHLLSISVVE